MAAYTIELVGAAGVTTVTPKFTFTGGTIEAWVEGVKDSDLTSGVEASISLSAGEDLEYRVSDWDAVTRIEMQNDKVSGDISGWTLPASLEILYVHTTSVTYGTGGAFQDVTSSLVKIDADGCGWTRAQVDRALKDLAASGVSSKALDIAGTNAGPSTVGATARALLAKRGWTLSTGATLDEVRPGRLAGGIRPHRLRTTLP